MLMFIPTYGILLFIRFCAVITKYTGLGEQQREAKVGKSKRQSPRSITRGATSYVTRNELGFVRVFPSSVAVSSC